MENRPDYAIYHVHELEKALARLDEAEHPEEAKLIREYIARGGYVYPADPVIGVRFLNIWYKWSLIFVLATLLGINALSVLSGLFFLPILPFAVEAGLLFAIAVKHKYTKTLIRAWAGLVIVTGVFGLLARVYSAELVTLAAARNLLVLSLGVAFFVTSGKFIELVRESSNKVTNYA